MRREGMWIIRMRRPTIMIKKGKMISVDTWERVRAQWDIHERWRGEETLGLSGEDNVKEVKGVAMRKVNYGCYMGG